MVEFLFALLVLHHLILLFEVIVEELGLVGIPLSVEVIVGVLALSLIPLV